jgi:putative ABC transport system ATP-binding protein
VAIARALINNPTLLLADEPTGNLDSKTSVEVMALFQQLNDKGITVIMVTHEPDIALYATRIVELRDGLIIRDERVMKRKRASEEILIFARTPPVPDLSQTPPVSRIIEPAIVV